MPVRPDPGRAADGLGRSRSAAAGTVDHRLLAHRYEQLPCIQEVGGAWRLISTWARQNRLEPVSTRND